MVMFMRAHVYGIVDLMVYAAVVYVFRKEMMSVMNHTAIFVAQLVLDTTSSCKVYFCCHLHHSSSVLGFAFQGHFVVI